MLRGAGEEASLRHTPTCVCEARREGRWRQRRGPLSCGRGGLNALLQRDPKRDLSIELGVSISNWCRYGEGALTV